MRTSWNFYKKKKNWTKYEKNWLKLATLYGTNDDVR